MTSFVALATPGAYWTAAAVIVAACGVATAAAMRHPGNWRITFARVVGAALAADIASYLVAEAVAGTWSAKTDLPLALCDMATVLCAAACWWRSPLLVEIAWFWGLAGTLQGLLTPDLSVGFPHLVFWQYVVGHAGVVTSAVFLVVGMGIWPRPGAVMRVLGLSAAYTAVVGVVDWAAGANYMFLRQPPSEWTLLRVLGPWPWYVLSATGVAAALFMLLYLPFWQWRRMHGASPARIESSFATREPHRCT